MIFYIGSGHFYIKLVDEYGFILGIALDKSAISKSITVDNINQKLIILTGCEREALDFLAREHCNLELTNEMSISLNTAK